MFSRWKQDCCKLKTLTQGLMLIYRLKLASKTNSASKYWIRQRLSMVKSFPLKLRITFNTMMCAWGKGQQTMVVNSKDQICNKSCSLRKNNSKSKNSIYKSSSKCSQPNKKFKLNTTSLWKNCKRLMTLSFNSSWVRLEHSTILLNCWLTCWCKKAMTFSQLDQLCKRLCRLINPKKLSCNYYSYMTATQTIR